MEHSNRIVIVGPVKNQWVSCLEVYRMNQLNTEISHVLNHNTKKWEVCSFPSCKLTNRIADNEEDMVTFNSPEDAVIGLMALEVPESAKEELSSIASVFMQNTLLN